MVPGIADHKRKDCDGTLEKMRIRMMYMAAGNSRRFGSNKLFYPIDGKPMYRHVLERLAAICERHSDWEIVLVSQYEELLEQGRTFAHRTVFSPESRDGASWTIKNGLKEADNTEAFVFFTAAMNLQPFCTNSFIIYFFLLSLCIYA